MSFGAPSTRGSLCFKGTAIVEGKRSGRVISGGFVQATSNGIPTTHCTSMLGTSLPGLTRGGLLLLHIEAVNRGKGKGWGCGTVRP
jgi:hypothetical protein